MKTALKIIAIILLLAFLAGFITLAVKSNGFRDFGDIEIPDIPGLPDDPSGEAEPYLEIAGEKYQSGVELEEISELRVDVKDFEGSFEVNIVPVKSFDFKVDGVLTKFPYGTAFEGADWNKAFNLVVGEGYFTFDNSNKKLSDILTEACFPGSEITDFVNINRDVAYFEIRVKAGDTTLTLPISGFYAFMDITLSEEVIIF